MRFSAEETKDLGVHLLHHLKIWSLSEVNAAKSQTSSLEKISLKLMYSNCEI